MNNKMFNAIRNIIFIALTFGLPIALLIYFRRDF